MIELKCECGNTTLITDEELLGYVPESCEVCGRKFKWFEEME